MRITKSKYVSFYQCPKRLYLEVHHPELIKMTEQHEQILRQGTNIGDLAMPLLGEYKDVTAYNGDILDIDKMLLSTKELMEEGYPNICEASFLLDNLYCAVDILHKDSDGYSIYEVKSTTKLEDYHIIDASFQAYVLKSLGIKVNTINVVTINPGYVRFGNLDIEKLFKINDITDVAITHLEEIPEYIDKLKNTLDSSLIPRVKLSKVCLRPFECQFKDYCFKDLKRPSIFELASSRKKFDYYEEGLLTFKDLLNSPQFKKLTRSQQEQIVYEVGNLPIKVDKAKLNEFLDKIEYPLYLLDFETMQPAIPLYNKTKPFQQIPFQYSLHIIESKGAKPIHKEFLAEEGSNPLYPLAISLLTDIPRDAMIMAYNTSFEMSRIKELMDALPKVSDELSRRLNFIDLMEPFKNHDVYKKEFRGSYSIKAVLPGLFPNDPDLDYKRLKLIHNGSEAMRSYEHILEYPKPERKQIREALLKYCELDTLAMVKILNKLYELSE